MSSQSEAGSMKDKITDLSMRINVQDEILDEQDKRIAGLEGGAVRQLKSQPPCRRVLPNTLCAPLSG
jgi:hypothetical protein